MKDKAILSSLIVLILLTSFGLFRATENKGTSVGLAVCTPTETKVAVGNQAATTILGAGPRSWAVVQQPANATNTVSVSFGGTAVVGSGYTLNKDVTGNDAASTTDQVVFGFATQLPTSAAISAITSTGSTTLNVIVCR